MLRLSTITNVDFLCFGIRIHWSERIIYIEISIGRLTFLIWLKDTTFIMSNYPRLVGSYDCEYKEGKEGL